MITKTANQAWKESKTTLPFKEWINREKAKHVSADGTVSDIGIDPTLNQAVQDSIKSVVATDTNYKTTISGNTVFGINKYVLYFSGAVILSAIAYKLYKKYKK